MVWYKKVLVEHKREIAISALYSIVFSLTLLLWRYGLGKSFVWEEIEPISAPGIFDRCFYSAFVFVTLGSFLYFIRFYQFLHGVIVGIFGGWRLYKDIKGFIWSGLILMSYFWVVPRIVDFLNSVISFFYNIFGFILYSLPSLGIALITCIPCFVLINKHFQQDAVSKRKTGVY